MYKDFEKDYSRHLELKARYDIVSSNNDETGMEKVRSEHRALMESIADKGSGYAKIYELYKEARDMGNDYIDINDVVRDAEELIATFRKFGVEKFTFSSTWSSAVKTAWEFVKSGCRQDGIMEINSRFKEFMSEEYERVPAYIFTIV